MKAAVRKAMTKQLKFAKKDAKAEGNTKKVEAIVEQLDNLRRRPCARLAMFGLSACTKTFTPALTISGRVTENYCSSRCAALSMHKRNGMPLALVSKKLIAGDEVVEVKLDEAGQPVVSVRAKRTPPRREVDADQLAALEVKYGPLQTISAVTLQRERSKVVTLACGHSKTVSIQAKNARCSACLPKVEKAPRERTPEQLDKLVKRSTKPAILAERAVKAAASDIELTTKYGPMRQYVKVVSESAGAKRVVLECGHEKTLAKAGKQGRCERCRDGKPVVKKLSGKAVIKAEKKAIKAREQGVRRERAAKKK